MDGVRVSRTVFIPAAELRFRFSRSGGPGGQNVNTRDTRVELLFDVTSSPSLTDEQRARAMQRLGDKVDAGGTLRIVASDARTQGANREIAVERFAETLARALRPPPKPRRRTRPSRGAVERRLDEKRHRSVRKKRRAWRPDAD